MKINKEYPYESEPVTQTLQGLSEGQQNTKKVDAPISAAQVSKDDPDKKKVTKVYEPKPLSPQDPVYSDIMEQFGARPVKPKYWFEEFGDYWSCSCGHINSGEVCEGCGLERQLLRKLFILHKPNDAESSISDRIDTPKKKTPSVQAVVPIKDSSDKVSVYPQQNIGTADTSMVPGNSNPLKKITSRNRNILIAIFIIIALAAAGSIYYYNNLYTAEAVYGSASRFMKSENYKELTSGMQSIGKYGFKDDFKRASYIAIGDNCLNKGKYNKALTAYKAAQDIDDNNDIKDKINDAKFAYVKANEKEGGDQFESYLSELKKASYPGVSEIYDRYYAWHMTIIANGSEDDFSNSQNTFRRSDTVFFHVSLTGGEPDEKIRLYYSLTWPSGARETQNFNSQWKSGSKITAHFSYPIALFGEEGKMTFRVFDSESNEELGSCSVNFID